MQNRKKRSDWMLKVIKSVEGIGALRLLLYKKVRINHVAEFAFG